MFFHYSVVEKDPRLLVDADRKKLDVKIVAISANMDRQIRDWRSFRDWDVADYQDPNCISHTLKYLFLERCDEVG